MLYGVVYTYMQCVCVFAIGARDGEAAAAIGAVASRRPGRG
jgi:hypothetical protein